MFVPCTGLEACTSLEASYLTSTIMLHPSTCFVYNPENKQLCYMSYYYFILYKVRLKFQKITRLTI